MSIFGKDKNLVFIPVPNMLCQKNPETGNDQVLDQSTYEKFQTTRDNQ